jgi:hypothetical protein
VHFFPKSTLYIFAGNAPALAVSLGGKMPLLSFCGKFGLLDYYLFTQH